MKGNRTGLIIIILLFGLVIHGVLPANAGPGANFGMAPLPASLDVQAGMAGSSNITVTNISAVPNTIVLSSNNTSVCSLSSLTLVLSASSSENSTLTCQSASLATLVVNVTGTSGTINHFVIVTFHFKILVNLDANSTGQTDVATQPSCPSALPSPGCTAQAKSFRIGAVLNASTTVPVPTSVFGWQFQINYNASAFVPQDDPSGSSTYPDGALSTALFGSQITAGTVNWAAKITASQAFGSSQITHNVGPSEDGITVFFTIISPNPAVTISAKTLLGSVSFELLNKPTTPQTFTVTNVLFSDAASNPVLNVTSGAGVSETISNAPPIARFTVTSLPQGDSSCTPFTSSPCTAFAFRFIGSSSSDSDGTIADPAGYFWDFGDGTQDLATQGSTAIHDYGAPGTIVVTLRVQDDQAATGAARDSLGNVIDNTQPSHASVTVVAALGFTITADITALSIGPSDTGSIGTSTIRMVATQQTSGTVSLSASSNLSPSNAPTFSFNPAQVVLHRGGTNSSLLTVSVANNTPHFTYNVTVSAQLGQIINNVTILLVPTTLTVQPGVVKGVATGNTFTISVDTSAANLFGWQFQLSYNKTLLSASTSSVSFGSFWTAAASTQQAFLIKRVNQTSGTILMAVTLFAGAKTFTGNGTLATITFTVKTVGITALGLSSDFLINGVGLGQTLDFSPKNGLFCNSTCLDHDVAVEKFTITPSTATIGANVTFDATVSNIGLNTETVQLTYSLVTGGGTPLTARTFSLAPGNTTDITYTYSTSNSIPGASTITVHVAILGSSDLNPGNNDLSTQVTLSTGAPPTSIPYAYIIAAVVGVAIAAVAIIMLLRRRSSGQTRYPKKPPQPPARVK